jgi:hypothetical protein
VLARTLAQRVYQETMHFAQVVGQVRSVHCFNAPADAPHAYRRLLGDAMAAGHKVPAVVPHPQDLATLICECALQSRRQQSWRCGRLAMQQISQHCLVGP